MADAPLTPCPKCGAPCTAKVEMRGGDHGWGTTDAERTTYRYAHPQPPAAPLPSEMRRQMVEECGDDMEKRGIFASGWLGAEIAHGITTHKDAP